MLRCHRKMEEGELSGSQDGARHYPILDASLDFFLSKEIADSLPLASICAAMLESWTAFFPGYSWKYWPFKF